MYQKLIQTIVKNPFNPLFEVGSPVGPLCSQKLWPELLDNRLSGNSRIPPFQKSFQPIKHDYQESVGKDVPGLICVANGLQTPIVYTNPDHSHMP